MRRASYIFFGLGDDILEIVIIEIKIKLVDLIKMKIIEKKY